MVVSPEDGLIVELTFFHVGEGVLSAAAHVDLDAHARTAGQECSGQGRGAIRQTGDIALVVHHGDRGIVHGVDHGTLFHKHGAVIAQGHLLGAAGAEADGLAAV